MGPDPKKMFVMECNSLIDQFIRQAGLTVKGQHEYGLAGGRIDSKYGGVIIEYKDPKGAGKITENKNAPGVQAVVTQLKKRFRDFQKEEHISMERILGVGCDGDTIVFVQKRGAKLDSEDPQPGHAAYSPTPAPGHCLAGCSWAFLHTRKSRRLFWL